MSSVIISGDVSGTVTLQAPSAAGSTVVTLPSTSMNMGNGGGSVSTNTAFGTYSLYSNTTGDNNSAFGSYSLQNNTTGASNSAFGLSALVANTTGSSNTAFGRQALQANTTANNNTAVGYRSGYLNTTGTVTAFGAYSADQNTTGNVTAFGISSLRNNTTGTQSVGFGNNSLAANTTGNYNTAIGESALTANTTASENTAVGFQAGYSNTTGAGNVVFGIKAGYSITANSFNTHIGAYTGYNSTGGGNTFVGTTGSTGSVGCGYYMTTGNNNTIIGGFTGNTGGLDIRTSSNYIVLSDGAGNPLAYWGAGYVFLPSAYSITTASAANLFVASDGTLRRSTSALKYKQDVRDLEEMDINLLRAVRYKSKSQDDDQTKDHFGLIADEAAEAGFEELVTRGADGEIEGFQYERLTVVLLKSLQTLKAQVDAQAAEIATLKGQA